MEFPREPKAMTSKRQNRSDSRRATAALPADYNALLVEIKNRIRTAQICELICQPRTDPTLLGYRAPHRRAAASSRMGRSVIERAARSRFPTLAGLRPSRGLDWRLCSYIVRLGRIRDCKPDQRTL